MPPRPPWGARQRAVRAAVLAAAVTLSALWNGSATAQPEADGRVVVQDLSWSGDARSLFFSAMRVKPDFSDYSPEAWSVYRYDLETERLSQIAARALYVASDPTAPRLAVGALAGDKRHLVLLDFEGNEIARLSSGDADDFAASWSPDGKRLAFTSRRDGRTQIDVVDADGEKRKALTAFTDASAYNPSWSPDGRLIAYYLERGDGKDQVYVMNSDGTEAVNLTRDEMNNVFPRWTPDGRILYVRGARDQASEIYTVKADGSEKSPLLGIRSHYACYSPDGARIAYLGSEESVVILDRESARVHEIPLGKVGTAFPVTNHFPIWSPTANEILLDSDRDGDSEVYLVDPATGATTQLTKNEASDGTARWSRDGRFIHFLSDRDGTARTYRMRRDGSDVHLLSRLDETETAEASDGRRLVVRPTSDGYDALYLVDPQGDGQTQLTQGASVSQQSFAPDGLQIVYESASEIVVLNADGSAERPIAQGTDPSWAPDGSLILFKTPSDLPGGFGWEVATIRPDGSDLRRLAPGVHPSWSPDGTRIAFMAETSTAGSDIWVIDRDGTRRRCLTCDR